MHIRVNNVMVELHMPFMHVDFVIMDIENNTLCPIIPGKHFYVSQMP
jgi:hypothetical protein